MAILERKTSTQIVEGLTCASCMAAFLAVWFDRISIYRNYRWRDSSNIFGSNMAPEAISECLIFLGDHAPRPPHPQLVHTKVLGLTTGLGRTTGPGLQDWDGLRDRDYIQWPCQSKTAGSGPAKQLFPILKIYWRSLHNVFSPILLIRLSVQCLAVVLLVSSPIPRPLPHFILHRSSTDSRVLEGGNFNILLDNRSLESIATFIYSESIPVNTVLCVSLSDEFYQKKWYSRKDIHTTT